MWSISLWFGFISLWCLTISTSFHVPIGHACIFFGEINIFPIFKFNFAFLFWVVRFLYISFSLYSRHLQDTWLANIFLPFCGLSFHFLESVFWRTSFRFWWSSIYWVFSLWFHKKVWCRSSVGSCMRNSPRVWSRC